MRRKKHKEEVAFNAIIAVVQLLLRLCLSPRAVSPVFAPPPRDAAASRRSKATTTK
jgi:hypothetical protein